MTIRSNDEVLIEDSEFRNNFEAGVLIFGEANVTVRNSIIADTQEFNTEEFARGISVGNTSTLTIEDSEIVGNANVGVFAWGESRLTIRNSKITDTTADTDDGNGNGLTIRGTVQAIIENTEINRNLDSGVVVFDSPNVAIRNSIIANTKQVVLTESDRGADRGRTWTYT